MFSEHQIMVGVVSSLATLLAVLGLMCFVGYLALRKTKI